MYKKLFVIVLVALCMASSLQAQIVGWPEYQSREQFSSDPEGQNITIERGDYSWRPFGREVGYAIYGSRYRKAAASKGWGVFLSCIVAPVAGLATGASLDVNMVDQRWCVIGGALVCGGILGVSIPLWSKGQRELDSMLDDYVRRYGPKPKSENVSSTNLSVGPTCNGFGFALNF